MKICASLLLCFLLFFAGAPKPINRLRSPQQNPIDSLIALMTMEEKVGQMTQLNLDVVCEGDIYKLVEPHHIDSAKLYQAIAQYHVGSILNCGGHSYPREQWLTLVGTIQRFATTKSRLKIPILYGIDAIHGANYVNGSTLFPQPLAQAATFDPELSRQAAEVTAYETRAVGIPWNFSPVLDVARHPAWSRFFETYGEDPLVCTRFGEAVIKGYQGNSPIDSKHVAACMKHFLGYSAMRTGKDRTPATISEIQLRELYIPPFKAAIDAGALTVMINSGEINGVAVHTSYDILTNLLRDELQFKGLAVTDWEDIIKLHKNHRVASSLKEAVYISVQAGIDMCMVPNDYDFTKLLIELVKEGRISESRLDVSVRRILEVKMKLNLFKNNKMPKLKDYPQFGSKEHADLSRNIAESSITLLENKNNILPLNENANVFVTGPSANSMVLLNGSWTRTWQGTDEKFDDTLCNTIKEAIAKRSKGKFSFAEGCKLSEGTWDAAAIEKAKLADVIVVCLGELPSTEKPGDIDDLNLPDVQRDYVKALSKLGKKMVFILVENRPRLISDIVNLSDAVLMAYQPGNYGGDAIANILFGDVNPSGKLPFTYPKFNQSLLWYDHKYTETLDPQFGNNGFQPQWEFGHGLSYSSIVYENMQISNDTMSQNPSSISLTVRNTSTREAKESVLLFISDRYASITPSVKKLKDFQKVTLPANSSKTVSFSINREQLKFCNSNGKWILEAGDMDVMIGKLTSSFYLKN
jgi:beta-glucosidase